MNAQKGFTLIELMIGVAILGVLFSIALPVYQDYSSRSQIAATISSFSGVKVGVVSYKYDFETCQGTNPYYQNDINRILNSAGSPVSSIAVTDNVTSCLIHIVFSNSAVPNLRGKSLDFQVNFDSSGSSSWVCSSQDIDNKLLPPNCRS